MLDVQLVAPYSQQMVGADLVHHEPARELHGPEPDAIRVEHLPRPGLGAHEVPELAPVLLQPYGSRGVHHEVGIRRAALGSGKLVQLSLHGRGRVDLQTRVSLHPSPAGRSTLSVPGTTTRVSTSSPDGERRTRAFSARTGPRSASSSDQRGHVPHPMEFVRCSLTRRGEIERRSGPDFPSRPSGPRGGHGLQESDVRTVASGSPVRRRLGSTRGQCQHSDEEPGRGGEPAAR